MDRTALLVIFQCTLRKYARHTDGHDLSISHNTTQHSTRNALHHVLIPCRSRIVFLQKKTSKGEGIYNCVDRVYPACHPKSAGIGFSFPMTLMDKHYRSVMDRFNNNNNHNINNDKLLYFPLSVLMHLIR